MAQRVASAAKRRRNQERHSVVCRLCGKGFKAITASHLRSEHGDVEAHPVLEYKERFQCRRAVCGETLQILRQNSRRRAQEAGTYWSKERVISALRQLARATRSGKPYRSDPKLVSAAQRRFGTVRAAARRAGVDYTELTGRIDWTRPRLLKEIRQLARQRKKHGVPAPVRLLDAAERLCGSWQAAVTAAGVDYDQLTKREIWTKDRILTAIRRLAKRPRLGNRGRVPRGLWCAAGRQFGNWGAAAQAAGVDYALLTGKRQWSRAAVLAEIRDLAERRRKEPTGQPPVLRQAAVRHFGSWAVAVRAAGYQPAELRRLRWAREAQDRR